MQIIESLAISDPLAALSAEQQTQATAAIEMGKIIFLPRLPFRLLALEQRFLSDHYVDPKTKNISYDLNKHSLRGVHGSPNDKEQMLAMLKRFSTQAQRLVAQLFPHYHDAILPTRASFRPVEISHRKTSYRKDDKRLHVDAFPANPNQGKRILRVFSNANPHGEDRVWRVGEPFKEVAKQFLPQVSKPWPYSAALLELLKITKSRRSFYDHIMLQIHDRMKADAAYQRSAAQIEFRFPPYSSWIVQTDQVSHAAMSGRYLFEQTFSLPVDAMQTPERSPLRILEQLSGQTLI